jgi:glycosyltransferase involved in cell wall biosynthesis
MYNDNVKNSPLVSVIIPLHNGEDFIGATIESVLAQSYEALEIIIVDDGSTDCSADIVRHYQERDDRIELISQANGGVAAARNAAIAHSSGSYIAPLDADDIWLPDKTRAQVDFMEASGRDVGLVYAWSVSIDVDGRCIGGICANQYENQVFPDLLFSNFVGNGSAPLIRRECFEQLGGYCEEFAKLGATGCEDRDLYLRIAENYKFGVVKRALIGYRQHGNNMSGNARTMCNSHKLAVLRLHDRRRSLPSRFLRQSRAFNALYLEGVAFRQNQVVSSFGYVLRAAFLDPGLILKRGYIRLLRLRVIQVSRRFFGAAPRTLQEQEGRLTKAKDALLTFAELEKRVQSASSGWVEMRKRQCSRTLVTWLTDNGQAGLQMSPR